MVKRIALFNHKGGVSKTTTTFHLGWMLATKGKRVILVDTDPQGNLTGLVLGYKGPSELEYFYKAEHNRNLKSGLAPAFESRPIPIGAVDCVTVEGQEGLFLLPGHIKLAEYEVTLGIAQELSGAIQTLQNLPGSISHLLEQTAIKFKADYILIDMSPSLSAFNQNLLMTSHFFILPTMPDYFSIMAIDSLVSVLPHWSAWAKKAANLPTLKNAVYPFPNVIPKFLGTIIQNYRLHGGKQSRGFQQWIDEINQSISAKLFPELAKLGMTLPLDVYKKQDVVEDYCLATISDFNTLIAKSQEAQTPVFALSPEQIGQVGGVLQTTLNAQSTFKTTFSDLADKVIGLTSYENGN